MLLTQLLKIIETKNKIRRYSKSLQPQPQYAIPWNQNQHNQIQCLEFFSLGQFVAGVLREYAKLNIQQKYTKTKK